MSEMATTTTITSLTLGGAQKAIEAAMAKAHEIGDMVNISVCDAASNELMFVRMDGAPLISGGIARDKAYTVTAFGPDTKDWWGLIKDEPALLAGIVKTDRLMIFGGGVAVKVGGHTVGSVGVSGSTSEGDHAIAAAGAGAVSS